MVHAQRYVSNELSHFVGRGKTEDEQYDILVNKVLKTGLLTYRPHDPMRPRSLGLDFSQPISANKALQYEVVCFCDIPEPDLAIHVSKYSRFGLSFEKGFLIARGACPVFYVANESPVSATEIFSPESFVTEQIHAARALGVVDRALYFSTSVRAILDIFAALDAISYEEDRRFFKGGTPLTAVDFKTRLGRLFGLCDAQIIAIEHALRGNEQAAKSIENLRNFIINEVFSFIKCFEATRAFDDEANHYMEREWRVANNVNFVLCDVSRVFLPAAYAHQFRADLPAYVGQVSFVD